MGLSQDHDRLEAVPLRQLERLPHPDKVCGVALYVLGICLLGPAEIVVTTDHVQRDEHDLAVNPAQIFPKLAVRWIAALTGIPDRSTAQGSVAREERIPDRL